MWPFSTKPRARAKPPLFFTNTLSGRRERFVPLKAGQALMYSCGPTVYSRAHIGNLRAYVFADLIARALTSAGLRADRVINITDVGHLVGDGDEGEDKMSVGSKREGISPKEIAERYAGMFIEDIHALNLDTAHIRFPRATDYIAEQIAMVKTLEEKGFAYRTSDGVYFDTAKFPGYGKLGGVDHASLMEGARVEATGEKRNLHDFALWRNAKPGDLQQWDSPWGRGNPGWHIECSAMIRSLLGQEIDIHTGGMDHIPVHHNNEIAQSEPLTHRPLARFWIHAAFLTVEGEKISKSLGNDIYLSDIVERGYHPLALRYFFLQAHYRTPLSFSWTALASANEALERLWRHAREIRAESGGQSEPSTEADHVTAVLYDDLGTPQALGLVWEAIRDDGLSAEEKWGVLEVADAVLGLSLLHPPASAAPLAPRDIPEDIRGILASRDAARARKDFAESDRLRQELQNRGYRVEDSASGTLLTRERR
jgi:cysteinyl-tRNA synthetase